MREDGWLSSERAGRQALYRLSPVLLAAQERVERQLRGDRPLWHGSFSGVLYTVPERFRPYRDRFAADLWDLAGVAAQHKGAVADFDRQAAAAKREPPAGPAALRAFAAAVLPLYQAGAADPDLPAELLPADWPGQELGAAIGRAFRRSCLSCRGPYALP